MKVIYLLTLLAIVSAKTKINPNVVNLALETSLIFDGDNTKKDLTFIDGLQNFLNKLKTYLKLREQASFRTENLNDGIFTDFFRDFSRIIINYDNEALKNITDVLALVMEPYYYKGTTFHKIIEDDKLKSFIKDKIMDWADTDPKILKYQMAVAVMSKENTPLTQFGSQLNKYFSENDSKKLKKILKKFNKHENSNDMHKLVKKALGFLIFHRFNKLNESDKKDLSSAIKSLTDFLLNDTPKSSSPKNSNSNDKQNRTLKNNIRRSQIKINSLLPKKIVLHKNVEFNVNPTEKEEKKETESTTDVVTENKDSTKSLKVKKWEKIPYMTMELKLNDDKHIATETKDHEVDTIILDNEKKGNKKDELNTTTTLEVTETEATPVETSKKDDTKDITIEDKDRTNLDLYKHIMSINVDGEKRSKTTDKDAQQRKNDDTENKNDRNDNNSKTEAQAQNSEEKANTTKDTDPNSAQDKILDTIASPKDETNGKERRMGVSIPKGPADVDVAVIDTDTEELKKNIEMNPHQSKTVPVVFNESSSLENRETTRHDDIGDSDKEEYQNKVADGAKKIRNLLDNAIAMKLLGIT